MEAAGRTFLKEQKEKASSQTFPEIVEILEHKLFDVFKEAPEANGPPQHLHPRPHKLSFPTYDGKEDPLPWINRCEQFFRGQMTPEHDQVWYASYHLTGTAQQWYMRLTQDKVVTDWAYFARCVNERFGPPTRRNPLGELAALRKTGTVDDYMERFLALVARAGTLDERQQVNIYTAGLLEPLKTDVELQDPQDMEMAMSLARAYERRLAVIVDSNKSTASQPTHRPLALKAPMTPATPTPSNNASPTTLARPFKRLTLEEMAARRQAGLCFNCDEPFSRGHKCKLLFDITAINSYDTDDSDNSFMMMIGTPNAAVHGCTPMYLTGVIVGTGVFILVDTGATHNIIDINVARLIALREQCIDTTILVGSGNEVTCQAASFSTLLRVDDEVFTIDAFLLDIGNDIDVVLGTPWLASLGRLTWDFTTMDLQYHDRGRPVTLTSL
jgi:hypothetical protein